MSQHGARPLGALVAVLVLDLLAFTAILPVFFPAVRAYGAESVDGDGGLFGALARTARALPLPRPAGAAEADDAVYVGGVLGSLFSLLQLTTSPLVGWAADRVGRRPMVLLCATGSLLAYACWLLAGSFELFVLARVVGGATRGLIQLSTTIVADVTGPAERTRGMALVGGAFSVGFALGPAVGAYLADVRLPSWLALHPFAPVALWSLALSAVNLVLAVALLPETMPRAGSEAAAVVDAKAAQAAPVLLRQVHAANVAYMVCFAGLEFTLTYLAIDRFSFADKHSGRLLGFMGLVAAAVQGGYLRRVRTTETAIALQGMVALLAGLVVLALATTTTQLYVGAALFAFASATVVSCLTSLASKLCAPAALGRTLGHFRAGGQLGRAIGPALFAWLYWARGGRDTYLFGAACVVLPLVMTVVLHRAVASAAGKAKTQ